MGIRILLADDHALIRQEIISLLNHQPDLEIIGEAGDGHKAVELARQLQPDIVITDISMPNLNGIEAARQIKLQNTNIKIIALSGHPNEIVVTDMLEAGASAYVLKECLFNELLTAIKAVNNNEIFLSKKIIMAVVKKYIQHQASSNITQYNFLSEQERKILRLISEGKSTKQIAQELHISNKAIETIRINIMEKLLPHNISELVKIAIANGLTHIEL